MRSHSFAALAFGLGLQASAAYAADIVTCFNDSGPNGEIGVWSYEGHTDWKAARIALPPTFVFSFAPGRSQYDVRDLKYCFFMPNPKSGHLVKCGIGSVRISKLETPRTLSGTYRFVLVDGAVKAREFDADYCPKVERK